MVIGDWMHHIKAGSSPRSLLSKTSFLYMRKIVNQFHPLCSIKYPALHCTFVPPTCIGFVSNAYQNLVYRWPYDYVVKPPNQTYVFICDPKIMQIVIRTTSSWVLYSSWSYHAGIRWAYVIFHAYSSFPMAFNASCLKT